MSNMTNNIAYAKRHPVRTGVVAIVATLALGAGVAFSTGMATPHLAEAFDVLPPCCVIVPLPPPPLPPMPDFLPPCCEVIEVPTTPAPPGPDVLPPCCEVVETPPAPPPPGPDVLPPCCEVIVTTPPPPPPIVEIPPVIPPPPPPEEERGECVYLTASPQVITAPGQAVTLTWATDDVDSISIDQGVGRVTPTGQGSIVVHPTGNTTWTATVTGGDQSPNCRASVRLETTVTEQPRCIDLSANKTLIDRGEEVILSWRTQNASSVSLNHGIGSVTPVAAGSIAVHPTSETTYIATVPGAPQNPACEVTVRLREERDRDHNRSHHRRERERERPLAFIESTNVPPEAPLASVYLSEIPYTGLDLGPVGTVLYWLMLVLWSMAAAYLVIFTLIPYVFGRRAPAHGGHTGGDLPGWGSNAPTGHDPVMTSAPAPQVVHNAAHAAAVASAMPARSVAAQPARPSIYSPHEGFRSFGNGTLTIDDIVKGLSRESGMEFEREMAPEPVRPVEATRTALPVEASKALPAPEYSDDVPGFLEALLAGDRDRVFGTVRGIVKEGGDSEHFLSQAVCALDDAYRSRIEGTNVHPEIERVTRGCHTSFLERLVSSLATAVDSSYSAGVTASKLALTRALAVVNG